MLGICCYSLGGARQLLLPTHYWVMLLQPGRRTPVATAHPLLGNAATAWEAHAGCYCPPTIG